MLRLVKTDSKKTILVKTDIVAKRIGTPQHSEWVNPLRSKAYEE